VLIENLGSLVPGRVEARAKPFKRLGIAFGRRFFVLGALGLGWLVPAFVERRFVSGMIAWDALLLLAFLLDLWKLPPPAQLSLSRSWTAPLAISVSSSALLTVANHSRSSLHLKILDTVPSALRETPPELEISVWPASEAGRTYSVSPLRRGDFHVGSAFVRYQSFWRLAERWSEAPLAETVRVYPNLEEAKRHSVYLLRSRQIEMEKRRMRLRGAGRSFESLREYRDGDELRDVCWTASARRGKLVTRLYQVERSQTIWMVLDAGRLMRTRIGNLSKLDYAANAALSLAQVALYSGDRVGLLAYGRRIRARVPAARGATHLRQLVEQLALVPEDSAEGDHLRAAAELLHDQKRRSLVVWITDLAETSMTPEVMDAAALMMPRHLVFFAVIGQPDLAEQAEVEPRTVSEMYQSAAAQEVLFRRESLLARMRQRGALALEVNGAKLAPAVVNSYLEIKARGRL
jgi:uncharacterized protein (DUF58 family)